jgi:hypothetical protein
MSDSSDRPIVEGILRDAIKLHFKNNQSCDLGPLWQDYNAFCQYPTESGEQYIMCRRFECSAKALKGGKWVIQVRITTATIDGKTFEDYYRLGEVHLLAQRLEAKRRDRVNRQNRPVAVRVLHQYKSGSTEVKALELEDFDRVFDHAKLSTREQRALAASELKCKQFNKAPISFPLSEIRLILDTKITQEEHSETIIEPDDRGVLMGQVWSFLSGVVAFGRRLELSAQPIDAESFESYHVLLPAVQVRDSSGSVTILKGPADASEEAIKSRALARATHVRRNGFLVRRPINPALGWPAELTRVRGERMRRDLEFLLSEQGVEAKLGLIQFNHVQDLRRKLDEGGHDSLLAVLPEPSYSPQQADDTHEKLKRLIEVPSQCIHYDNTLPQEWANKPWREFRTAQPKLANRVRDRYELCLANLLVKHHWFPFVPAQPFHYNVHVGLDVGGVHDTSAVACIGYGFRRPLELLLFRPEEIPIQVEQKEPIPTDCLYRGLLTLFETVEAELTACGLTPDFDTVLFYRDGLLLGGGDAWNERGALERLHAELRHRKWVSATTTWTALEIMKGGEGWRVLRNHGGVINPLVGKCLFPFEDERMALVCTTGAPYLPQGTARPPKVHIVDISGEANRGRVLTDLVWECDMCFSKPDMGMSLPWVLNVADTGALQLSRSYKITGITA